MIKTRVTRKYRRNLSMMLALLLLASSAPVKGGTSLAAPTSVRSAAAAGGGFVYVTSSFISFGDSNPEDVIPFTLPEGLTGRGHVMVQARGVSTGCNIFEINGDQVNVLINRRDSDEVHTEYNDISSDTLRSGANTLRIRARTGNCTLTGDLDDFSLTNIVVFYQTQ
jgi:hypothetical protein